MQKVQALGQLSILVNCAACFVFESAEEVTEAGEQLFFLLASSEQRTFFSASVLPEQAWRDHLRSTSEAQPSPQSMQPYR